MTQTFESWLDFTVSEKISPADTTIYISPVPTVTAGRVYLKNSAQEEWISFTWVWATSITGCTRWLSQTADPATSGTGLTWVAWSKGVLVAMHDQLPDKQQWDAVLFSAKVYATTAARDSALGADWAATKAYTWIYVTATWLHYNYNLSSNQWESVDTGTTTPDATTTAAGKVEQATAAEVTAGASTWWTGAALFVTPADIAKVIQSGSYVYVPSTTGSDTYVWVATPTLTTYTTGMLIISKFTTANTWAATFNIDWLWAKSIKTQAGNNLRDWDIPAWGIVALVYDGTNFVLVKNTADSISKFWGTGADGAVDWTAGITVTGSNNTYIVKNYTTWAAWGAARTLTITPTWCILHIKIKWDADFTNRTFDLSGKWGAWASAISTPNTAWSAGTTPTMYFSAPAVANTGGGWGWVDGATDSAAWGWGWGGASAAWSAWGTASGATGGTAGAKTTDMALSFIQWSRRLVICPWAWWGSWALDFSGWAPTSWAWGNGGGALIIEVGGNLTLDNGTTVITCAGSNWGNAAAWWSASVAGGWGWWGGWWSVYIMYNGSLTGTVTPTVTGGSWGTKVEAGASYDAGNGGAWWAWLSLIESNVVFS